MHEYLSADWANRSLPLKDRIDGIQVILSERKIEATDREVQTAIERQPFTRILGAGLIMMAILYIFRITGAPDWFIDILLGFYGVMLVLLLTGGIGGHFQRYRSPKK